jgi:hypothetical protein
VLEAKQQGQNDTSCSSNNGSCVIALALPYARISCYLTQLSCQYIIQFKRHIQGYNTVSTGKCLPRSQSNTPSLSLEGVEKAPPWRKQYIRNRHLTVWATARPKWHQDYWLKNFIFCWPCISVKFLLITNLTHSFQFIYFTSLHVSSNPVLIIRRINCINTSSGI